MFGDHGAGQPCDHRSEPLVDRLSDRVGGGHSRLAGDPDRAHQKTMVDFSLARGRDGRRGFLRASRRCLGGCGDRVGSGALILLGGSRCALSWWAQETKRGLNFEGLSLVCRTVIVGAASSKEPVRAEILRFATVRTCFVRKKGSHVYCLPGLEGYIVLFSISISRGNKLIAFWIVNVLGDFRKTLKVLLPCLVLILFATPSLALAQEAAEGEEAEETTEATELEQAPVVPQTEIEEVVVTGSRLQRTPGELAGKLITLDEDYIRSTGEVTLERVLRQRPQNTNPSQGRYGSGLNTATNFSGASTVNLRGLGSESTLILVDGKRIGHSGLLGGVSDVSQIPLSMVERIEVLLDGASAIYGSDAVGGVVNIITPKGLSRHRAQPQLQLANQGRVR